MSGWKDIDDDDRSPFGEAPVDAIVYAEDDISPELKMDEMLRSPVDRGPRRPAPRRRRRTDHAEWEPPAPAPAVRRSHRRPRRIAAVLAAVVPVSVLVLLTWFFIGVYQGKFLSDGTAPSRPGPQAPATPSPLR